MIKDALGLGDKLPETFDIETPEKVGFGKAGVVEVAPKSVGKGLVKGMRSSLVRPPDRPFKRSEIIVPEFDVDFTQGIKATPRFVPFGRLMINRNRLDKDIVALKKTCR